GVKTFTNIFQFTTSDPLKGSENFERKMMDWTDENINVTHEEVEAGIKRMHEEDARRRKAR
ncbi:MAG: hypothetical protein R3361_09760, partial [Aequorivita vladivostokensis]|nr:hypothetical protein [Aequorivita vladivostokensis]